MHLKPLYPKGPVIIELEKFSDERGFFARLFCRDLFESNKLHTDWPQSNVSVTRHAGTIRGLHCQKYPYSEPKVVRCVRGRVMDVVIDLRSSSPYYRRVSTLQLDDDLRQALYIPAGFVHGFQTLCDDVEMHYQMGALYRADHQDGVRWNDPAFSIDWPLPPRDVSRRDAGFPDFSDNRLLFS